MTQTDRVGVVGEFVVNVTVAVFEPAVAGMNVSVNGWLPPAGMFEAVVGEIKNSLAFVPDNAAPVMFNGCELGALLITMFAVVCLGNPVEVTLAVPGVAQLPPDGVVTEGCGGRIQAFVPGG